MGRRRVNSAFAAVALAAAIGAGIAALAGGSATVYSHRNPELELFVAPLAPPSVVTTTVTTTVPTTVTMTVPTTVTTTVPITVTTTATTTVPKGTVVRRQCDDGTITTDACPTRPALVPPR